MHAFDDSNLSQEIFAIDTWRAIIYSLGHGRKHMLAILPTIWRLGFNKENQELKQRLQKLENENTDLRKKLQKDVSKGNEVISNIKQKQQGETATKKKQQQKHATKRTTELLWKRFK